MCKYCDDVDSKAMFDELPDPKPKKRRQIGKIDFYFAAFRFRTYFFSGYFRNVYLYETNRIGRKITNGRTGKQTDQYYKNEVQ